jgi:hypothetical protein
MKSFYVIFLTFVLIASGNNRDAEYPDDDEQEQDSSQEDEDDNSSQTASYTSDDEEASDSSSGERGVPPPGQWTEEDRRRFAPSEPEPAPPAPVPAPAPAPAPAPTPTPQLAPGEWKPRVAADTSPEDDQGRRNFTGTALKSGDVLFEIPMFWAVKSSTPNSAAVREPRSGSTIFIGEDRADDLKSVELFAEKAYQRFQNDQKFKAAFFGPHERGWMFSLEPRDENDDRHGRVVVLGLPYNGAWKIVVVMGFWPPLSQSDKVMKEFIRHVVIRN